MILNNMERIKIGFNWEKCDRLRTHLEETAKYANSVLIPLFKEYGLATDIEDIISACNQKEHFYKLLKAQATKGITNKFLKDTALQEASRIFENVRTKMRNDCIISAERKYLELQGDRLTVLANLIESDCDIVLENPEDIKHHKELEKICKDIEAFCRNAQISPMYFSRLLIITADHIEPNSVVFPLLKA